MLKRVLLVTASLLQFTLIGCFGGSEVDAGADPAAPVSEEVRRTYWMQGLATMPTQCVSFIICFDEYPSHDYHWPDNETVTGYQLQLNVANAMPPGTTLAWTLTCHDAAGDACVGGEIVDYVEGAPPLAMNLDRLDLSKGEYLRHRVILEGTVNPLDAVEYTIGGYWFMVSGPALPIQWIETFRPISYEGVSGPCVVQLEPECDNMPGGTRWMVQPVGSLRRLWLNVSWTPLTEATREMSLVVQCHALPTGEACPANGRYGVSGPSPIRFKLEGVVFDPDHELEIRVQPRPVIGLVDSTPLLRQEYLVDGGYIENIGST